MRMKTYPLLAAAALILVSCELPAYQIVESHFHVQIAPDKYVDQLVLRCEDGHRIIVPWQSKLAESCGEDLMGNVTRAPADSKSAPIDEQEKQAMLTQLRSQYGNISDRQIEFSQGPAGLTTRFKAPIVEILKKYESCRKSRKDKVFCADERERALSRLADPEPAAAQAEAQTPAVSEPRAQAPRIEPTLAAVSAQPAQTEPVAAAGPIQATPAEPAPPAAAQPPPRSDAEARANAERRIAEDHVACMRAKPKYDCDQSRAKAIGVLDNPKPAKPQRPRKQAAAAVETQAAR
jgi:hypothetical protein